jgi:dolichol-phosphate mannosyltransferase
MVRLSVLVPLYNEESVLPALVCRIRDVVDLVPGGPHEMVFVDDGSSDTTPELLRRAAALDPRLLVISLSRNFGHQAAISAALDHANGDVVVVMDGDLQDPPEAIPQLIREFERGFEVVRVRRVDRQEAWYKRMCYALSYRVISALSDVPLPIDVGDFGLMSHRVVQVLRLLPERNRYLRGLRAWVGFSQTTIEIARVRRESGKSKYTFRKLVSLALDGAFAFSVAPLRAAAIVGVATITASVLYVVYALYAKFIVGRSPQGFTALIMAMTFLSGVQLMFLGIIGEYVGRVYEETKRRPAYVVGSAFRSSGGRAEEALPSAAAGDRSRLPPGAKAPE